MSVLEDMGNAVKITLDDKIKIVPAVNIQVDNVPGYLPNMGAGGGKLTWYGVYFEIMFEDGSLWIVEQQSQPDFDKTIQVFEFYDWAHTNETTRSYDRFRSFNTWSEFVAAFSGFATTKPAVILCRK